jgi:putative two-component system response regulator
MLEVRLLYKRQRWQAEHFEAMVRERTTELHETRLEIIRRLGRAGEYRDNETGMHIMRMSKGCQRLALAAGLDENQAALILQASPMHDVGKIGIPDRILLKPGRLEGEEWEIMKTHAEIGAKILEGHSSDIMELARSIALSHHEKWDGSGYPYGSKDVAIPIEGRIAAVCDVFDALTSERPYKKAWSVEDGMDFIKDNAGSHFDPN